MRFAVRGVARKDKEHAAAALLASILEARLKTRVPAAHRDDVFVRNDAHVLPGVLVVGFNIPNRAGDASLDAGALITRALAEPVTEAELSTARAGLKAAWNQRTAAKVWLDADTFSLSDPLGDLRALDAATLSAVNAFARKVSAAPMASVLVNTPPAS